MNPRLRLWLLGSTAAVLGVYVVGWLHWWFLHGEALP